jgi:hypothetical protein
MDLRPEKQELRVMHGKTSAVSKPLVFVIAKPAVRGVSKTSPGAKWTRGVDGG